MRSKLIALAFAALLVTLGLVRPAEAAISCTLVINNTSITDNTAFTIASHTIHANRLVLIAIGAGNVTGNTTAAPSLSGHSATYVQVGGLDSLGLDDPARSLWLFRTMKSSDDTGTIGITFGTSQTRVGWTVVECDGVDTSGTNGSGAIVQTNKTNIGTGTSLSVTLSACASGNNRPLVAWRASNTTAITLEGGWTSLPGGSFADAEGARYDVAWTTSSCTDVTPSMTYGSSVLLIGVATEIKAAEDTTSCTVGGGLFCNGVLR